MSRCLAISHAIKKNKHKANIMFMVKGDDAAKYFLDGYKIKSVILDWLKERNRVFPLLKQLDLVLIDSYNAPQSFYRSLGEIRSRAGSKKPFLAAIDDYQRIDYPVDAVINPSIYGDSLSYNTDNKIMYLTGKEYVILRKEFWRVPQKKINKDIKRILITLGGSDNSAFVESLIISLSARFPGMEYHIVSNRRPDAKLGTRLNWYFNIPPLTMRNLMLRCDLCISAGGQTLYELIRLGVPAIGICFAKNQILNLTAAGQNRLLKFAGWAADKDIFNKIIDLVERYSYKDRVRLSKKCRKSIGGDGAVLAAKKILK